MLKFTVPLFESANDNSILDKFPLIKLRVFDLISNKSATSFKIEKNIDFLKLENATGKLWFLRDKFGFEADVSEKVIDDIVITATNRYQKSARVSIELTVKKFANLDAFCTSEDFCFYDKITHHIIEDISNDFTEPRDIGDLSPKLFSKICKSYSISYKQLNGEEMSLKMSKTSLNPSPN